MFIAFNTANNYVMNYEIYVSKMFLLVPIE